VGVTLGLVLMPPTARPRLAAALLVVAVGGAAGGWLRWALQEAFPSSGGDFPWTTFAINVSGSLLLALLPAVPPVRRRPLLPPLLGTGVLGGFTTLSASSEETRLLLAAGHTGTAAAYLLGTLAACLLAVAAADALSSPGARRQVEDEEGDL
jgi:fluoride exporter